MPYTAVEIEFRVQLRSALHIGTGFGLAQILDSQIVRGPHPDAESEFPYIPGSSLKGRLRHHVRQMGDAIAWSRKRYEAAERRLFGTAESPGALMFSNAMLDADLVNSLNILDQDNRLGQYDRGSAPSTVENARTFVSLSPQRRVALEQRLFSIQATNGQLSFVGRMTGALPAATAQQDLTLLAAAARQLTHLGGHKARGLGLCQVDLDVVAPPLIDWAILMEAL